MRRAHVWMLLASVAIACQRPNPAFWETDSQADTGEGDPSGTTTNGSESSSETGASTGTTATDAGDGDGDGDGDGVLPADFDCVNDAALVACWRLDGDGIDATGNGHDLTLGSVQYSPGVQGQAGTFTDASTASTPTTGMLSLTTKLTAELWYAAEDPTSSHTLLEKGLAYTLRTEGAMLICDVGIASLSFDISGFVSGQWHHIACTFDGGALSLYIDGLRVSTGSTAGQLTISSEALHLASASPGHGNKLYGQMDIVRIWNVARDATQVCAAAGGVGCSP